MTTIGIRVAAVGCMLFFLASMRGQGSPTLSPDRVTFYTEPNFKGEALVIEAGASVVNLDTMVRTTTAKPWTFAISSVRVDGAAKATVYSAVGFAGERLEIARNQSDLYAVPRNGEPGATWDRAIASIVVSGPPRTVVTAPPAPLAYPHTAAPVRVVPVPARPPPAVMMREVPPRLDRRTADLIVQRAYRDVLNRPADPEGLRTYRDRLLYKGWSERQVIDQLQRSPEARSLNPDTAIHRAYRDVLGRDADPQGLAHYRARWHDGWTQGQIRDDLRRSEEGRAGYIRNAITRAYREVLGREPDPAGYANYERLMREKGYSERDVRNALMSGDEYRQRRGTP